MFGLAYSSIKTEGRGEMASLALLKVKRTSKKKTFLDIFFFNPHMKIM